MTRPTITGTLCLNLLLFINGCNGDRALTEKLTSPAFLNVTMSVQVSVIDDLQCQKQLTCHVSPVNGSLNRILEITILEKTAQIDLKKVASIFHLQTQNSTIEGSDAAEMLRGVNRQNGDLVVQKSLLPNTGFAGEDFVCKVLYVDGDTFRVRSMESPRLQQDGNHVCKVPNVLRKLDALESQMHNLSDFEARDKKCEVSELFPKLDYLDSKVGNLSDVQRKTCNLSQVEDKLDILERKIHRLSYIETKMTELLAVETDMKSRLGDDCDRYRDLDEGSLPQHIIVKWSDGTKVLCDTKTGGGGWTIFQRRVNGSVDFYRGWDAYETGFGNLDGEFWWGLDPLQRLLEKEIYELRVDIKYKDSLYHAVYSHFRLSSAQDNYRLDLGSYSGTAGDSMEGNIGHPFSTKDRDNDRWDESCAQHYHGGWWYGGLRIEECHWANLNGLWNSTLFGKGLNWATITSHLYSASYTEMKVRRRK